MLLADGERRATVLLEQARLPDRSAGPLARTLESYFVQQRLALPTDQNERLATRRRQSRIAAVPGPFRPAVASFADGQLAARDRARRAGTRPRDHHTIDTTLSVVRTFAEFLTEEHPAVAGWESVNLDHVEFFLAELPRSRPRRLTALRQFFGWACRHRVVLVDPTSSLPGTRTGGSSAPSSIEPSSGGSTVDGPAPIPIRTKRSLG